MRLGPALLRGTLRGGTATGVERAWWFAGLFAWGLIPRVPRDWARGEAARCLLPSDGAEARDISRMKTGGEGGIRTLILISGRFPIFSSEPASQREKSL